MKVAIVLCGNVRTFAKTKDNFFKNLAHPLDVDIFFFTWETVDSITPSWWKSGSKDVGLINEKELLDTYHPKSYVVASNIDFSSKDMEVATQIPIPGLYSMYYAWQKGYEVLEQYEKEHNIQYDVVIRTRFDLVLNEPIKQQYLCEFSKSGYDVVVPYSNGYGFVKGVGDAFVITKRKAAALSLNLTSNFNQFVQQYLSSGYKKIIPETLLGFYYNSVGIKYSYMKAECSLIRNSGEILHINKQRKEHQQLFSTLSVMQKIGEVVDDTSLLEQDILKILDQSLVTVNNKKAIASYLSGSVSPRFGLFYNLSFPACLNAYYASRNSIDKSYLQSLLKRIYIKDKRRVGGKYLLFVLVSLISRFKLNGGFKNFRQHHKLYFK